MVYWALLHFLPSLVLAIATSIDRDQLSDAPPLVNSVDYVPEQELPFEEALYFLHFALSLWCWTSVEVLHLVTTGSLFNQCLNVLLSNDHFD